MRLKTRVITSVVGLGVLALVLCFFDTLVFNVALAAVVLIALHEIYSAFALKCPAVYAGLVPITLFVFLCGENAAHKLFFWAFLYATVLFIHWIMQSWPGQRCFLRWCWRAFIPCCTFGLASRVRRMQSISFS